jgi:ubiquinone/menaquinone biosynthesis C-methylase UbiE
LHALKKAKRLVQHQSSIKLELGGGEQGREGWLNVDLYADNADLQLDLRRPLPFPDLSIEAIYSSHVLEHFSYPEPLRSLLRECFRVLKVGSVFSAAVPDAGRAFRSYAAGEQTFYQQKYWGDPQPNWCKSPMDDLNWLIYMGGLHKHMFDEQNLITRLEEAGFSEVRLRDFDETLDNPARRHQSLYVDAIKTRENPFAIDQAELCQNNDATAYDALWEDYALTQRYASADRIALWRRIAWFCGGRLGPLLDIGCGGGHLLEILSKEPGRNQTTLNGIDYSIKAIEQAQRRVPKVHFFQQDATTVEFPTGRFDTVICCEILEHVEKPAQVLAEAYRVLAPNGRLIITIPNGARDTYKGHTNFWDEAQFRDFCKDYPISHSESPGGGETLLFVIEKRPD